MSITLKITKPTSRSHCNDTLTLTLGAYVLCDSAAGLSRNPFALSDRRTIYGVPRTSLEGCRAEGCVSPAAMRDIHRSIADNCLRVCIEQAMWARGEDSAAHLRQKRAVLEAECVPMCFGRDAAVHAKPVVPVQLLPLFVVRMHRRLVCATDAHEFAAVFEQLKQAIAAASDAALLPKKDALELYFVLDFVRSSSWMHATLAPPLMHGPPAAFASCSDDEDDDEQPLPQQATHLTRHYGELRKRNISALISAIIEHDASSVRVGYGRAFPGALNLAARAETRLGCRFELVEEQQLRPDDTDTDNDDEAVVAAANPHVKRARKCKKAQAVADAGCDTKEQQ